MRVLCYAQTNIGSGRDNNEDNYYCNGTFKRDAAVPVAEAAAALAIWDALLEDAAQR